VNSVKKVLYIVTPGKHSEAVFNYAKQIAAAKGNLLTVLSISPKIPNRLHRFLTGLSGSEIEQLIAKEEESQIRDLVSQSIKTEPQTSLLFRIGDLLETVIEEVKSTPYSLVIKEKEEPEKSISHASPDFKLLRNCPVPVLLLEPNHLNGFQEICVAIDPLHEDPNNAPLNQRLLATAREAAKREQSNLHIVSAWKLFGDDFIRHRMDPDEFNQAEHAYKENVEKEMQKVVSASNYPGTKESLHLLHGDPKYVIPHFLKTHHIDLLVIGTVVRTGLQGVLIGNTAEKILGDTQCSLLTLKPEE